MKFRSRANRRGGSTAALVALACILVAGSTSGPADAATRGMSGVASGTRVHHDPMSNTLKKHRPALIRPAFLYQRVSGAADIDRLGNINTLVVTSNESQDDTVINAVRASKHKPAVFRYIQSYWAPADQAVDGLNLQSPTKKCLPIVGCSTTDPGNLLDYAFCKSGDNPLVGQVANGTKWYYLDPNKPKVRNYFKRELRKLYDQGYDGVFFDRGLAAFTGNTIGKHPDVWHRTSTCPSPTGRPTVPYSKPHTFADTYAKLLSVVHSIHEPGKPRMKLILNYGYSPFDPVYPLRPDPASARCRAKKFSSCPHRNDITRSVDYYLDEAVTHPKGMRWAYDFAANQANEHSTKLGGRVIGLVTDGQLRGHTGRRAVYFAYARARLFRMPVTVFTGDDHCAHITDADLCNRRGIFADLNSANFKEPTANMPKATKCNRKRHKKDKVHCVWYRTYKRGIVMLNASGKAKRVKVKLPGKRCHRLYSLTDRKYVKSGKCMHKLTIRMKPWSGQPMLYR